MTKTGKELKLNNFKNFNIAYGCINNKNPKAVYVNISSWIEPTFDCNSYLKLTKNLNKQIKQELFKLLSDSNFNKDQTIVDLDIRESGIKQGKKSFMNCEITFFLRVPEAIHTNKMKTTILSIVNNIISNVFNNSQLLFHRSKK